MGSAQVNLSWNASPGATQYILERSVNGAMWTVLANDVTTPSYTDTGLAASTTYEYCILAANVAGDSAVSPVASAVTSAAVDILSAQPLSILATRRVPFNGAVTTFTDANTATTARSFVAIIHWGDGRIGLGTIVGADGQFTVIGRHTYSAAGSFAVKVTVTMSTPVKTGTATTSTAMVSTPVKVASRKAARVRRVQRAGTICREHPWCISSFHRHHLL